MRILSVSVGKRMGYLSAILMLPGILGFQAKAQELKLTQSNPSGIYEPGEQIVISVAADGVQPDSVTVEVVKDFSSVLYADRVALEGDEQVVYSGAFPGPVAISCTVSAGEEWVATGLVVNPERFEPGAARPQDFDMYWKGEKKTLRKLKMVVEMEPLEGVEEGYECFDTEISCTGPKPARGYFAKPAEAEDNSLPIVLLVHAAGVKGEWCQSKPWSALRYAKMGRGALCFDLNAHGMLNGMPQSYYDSLEAGELSRYFYQGADNREDFYFRGMYLRLQRTLDFLAKQPEWDGRRIIVIGESQGGGQALAAAGLDKRVTAAVATVPAMCDWGGPLAGRKGGWPDPVNAMERSQEVIETVEYFDVAHLLKNSRATLFVEIGLIDRTCPSSSVYAAVNQSKGKKIICAVPYRGHHLQQDVFREEWEQEVLQKRNLFIADFLR